MSVYRGRPEVISTPIFRHPAHVSMLRRTHYTIWNKWLSASDVKFTDGPSFERYSKDFNQ
jgi:AraC family transcriptional regulator